MAEGVTDVTDLNPRRVRSAHSLSDSHSHAITCSQVSVYELPLGQILHPFGNLKAEANQVFDCGVL